MKLSRNRTGLLWKAAAALALAAATAGRPALGAEAGWLVNDAPVRFTVNLERAPTHASAGYFLQLPDGGILPGPAPNTQVFDRGGKALKSGVLWQNPESGLAVVFEAPKSGDSVDIYITRGAKLNLWTPDSGLTPSSIICTHPGHHSRTAAENLAKLGPVEAKVHYRNEPGSQGATLALPGDRSGRPGLASMYMLAYVAARDPGKTWVAPITFGGSMLVSIDGRMISPNKISDKQGGVGAHVELSPGLHRMELFGFYGANGGRPEMLLTWRTPKTTAQELGGIRPTDLRYPGTPMWEARQLHPDEIVRSGACTIEKVQSRDGGPVASFTLEPRHIYWFNDETPLLLYELRARTAGNPAGTQYTWSFSEAPDAQAVATNLTWLFAGNRDQRVTLKATLGKSASQTTLPFYPFTTQHSSLNDVTVRAAFRKACLNLFQACPLNKDPTAGWDASWWNNLFRTVELTRDNQLLDHLIVQRWDTLSKKLPVDRKELLEDLFLVTTSITDPPKALKWALQLEQKAPLKSRSIPLRLKGAEVLMYELHNLPEARKWVKGLATETGEGGEWAKIRMGDIEFLSRNLNEATQLYGDVQNRSKHGKAGPRGDGFTPVFLKGGSAAREQVKTAPPPESRGPTPPPGIAPWKLGAVRDVAASETVRNLIDQGFLWEAYQALRAWEREFPLSKISSDYLLLEGKLCLALGDAPRCRALLEAYCDQVDASNYMGEALQMIVRCMRQMNEPNDVVSKFQEKIRKRMAFE